MPHDPVLTIVVPVFQAAGYLENLTAELLAIEGVPVEVIFVDDCSSDDSAAIIRKLAAKHPEVSGIFHATNLGAGIARNEGFARARGRFTLFFDVDDKIHTSILPITLAEMETSSANLAMFPYRYERSKDASFDGMNSFDQDIWERYIGNREMVAGNLETFPKLLGFTNYPWNKIIRTAHFKKHGLKYGATKVNNDILGHWYSLLFSDRLILVNHILCTHVVHPTGANLTNQHSEVRLDLFEALNETYDLLKKNPILRQRYAHHFWDLAIRTASWARPRMAAEILEMFNYRLQELVTRIDLGDFGRMKTRRTPGLAQQLTKILIT
ncbi:MAG: glycosyltransferase family 2 protein [Paracoccaceae bacterium]|nr:glycosyltransferase family 2 protein [Paracoccaceae bacterium]